MQVKRPRKTQQQRLSEALLAIAVDVTADDRKAAENEIPLTKGTISKYLNGTVMNNDTAVTLLTFLRKRITKREKAIA